MIAVVAGLIERDGRVLIAQRPAGKVFAGCWEFPGGKLEKGETPERALARELMEELGALVEVGALWDAARCEVGEFDALLLFYRCALRAGEPRGLEGQRIEWVEPGALDRFEFAPADQAVAARLRREAEPPGFVYVTGGARSGKSGYAEALARADAGPVTYLATGRAFDDEMRARIARHRAQRPGSWATIEVSADLAGAIAGREGLVLLDCATLFITNKMLDSPVDWERASARDVEEVERDVLRELEALVETARAQRNRLIVVANEVGLGLVPPYPMGRAFRDIAGRAGQRLAALSDAAYLCVSGQRVRLK